MSETNQLAPMGFEDEEAGFQEFAKALKNFSKSKIESERRLPYNIDTGEFKMSDAETVDVGTAWEKPFIVIDKKFSVNEVTHRIVKGEIVKFNDASHVYWNETPAVTQENNPFFCEKEIEDC